MQDSAPAIDQQRSSIVFDENAGLAALGSRHGAASPEKGHVHGACWVWGAENTFVSDCAAFQGRVEMGFVRTNPIRTS
jgi:hypothetical protein